MPFSGDIDAGSIKLHDGGASGPVQIALLTGASGGVNIGGQGLNGTIKIADTNGQTNIALEGVGSITLGGSGTPGTINVANKSDQTGIVLDGAACTVRVGEKAAAGKVSIAAPNGQPGIVLDASDCSMSIGGQGRDGHINLIDNNNHTSIVLDALNGMVHLGNADCAEDFDITAPGVEPGTVMVIDSEGALRPSRGPYDKKVAGVLSGGGDLKPGITLDRQPGTRQSGRERRPLALLGKVYCKVDAEHAPIEVGDLLTTSSTPGHAMRAGDPMQAFGAVLGKALRPWKEGKGMIPILVTLQ